MYWAFLITGLNIKTGQGVEMNGRTRFGCAGLSINGGSLWRFRFVENRKKGKQVIVECFLLPSHSLSVFGAMAEGIQWKSVLGTNPSVKQWMKRDEARAFPPEHSSMLALELLSWCSGHSAYTWGAGALGGRTRNGGAGLGSFCLSCTWSSHAFVKNVHFSLIFGCKILSWFSSWSESESCKLLDLGRFSVQPNTTALCTLDKHSGFSWAPLCFYNLSANMT